MIELRNLQETEKFAKKIADNLKNGGLLCLYGEIGSGKTTFTKYFAQNFNLDEFSIKSPTFTYIREYKINDNQKLYHLDLYRLGQIDDPLIHDIEEILKTPGNITVIEWADRLDGFLPSNRLNLHFHYQGESARSVEISGSKELN